MKSGKLITLACGLALSLASLFAGAAGNSGEVLQRNNGAEPSTLDPQLASGTWEASLISDLFEGLVTVSADGRTIPGVASDWEISGDGLVYTFHLRDDARWSDGRPLTAADFVYAWRRMLDPALAASYAYMLYPLANARAINHGQAETETLGVRAENAQTLIVRLESPTPYLIQMLAHPSTYPVPRQAIEAHGSEWTKPGHMISNGAFELTEWVPNDHIRVERNDDFHTAAEVALDAVMFYPLQPDAAFNWYRSGALDIGGVPLSRLQWARDNLGEQLLEYPILGTFYFSFNQRAGEPLADARIRRALNLALRREVITDQITRMHQPAALAFVPPGISGYDGPLFDFADTPMQARQRRARKLMQEAGYGPEQPLTLTLDYINNEDTKRIVVAMAAMWRPIGINLQLRASDAAVYYAQMRQGQFQIGMTPWLADYDDASNFLDLFTSASANNYGGYRDPQYEELMKKAATTSDSAQRSRLMAHAEQRLLDADAMLPIYFYITTNLVAPRVSGWQPNPLNVHLSRWIQLNGQESS